MASAAPSPLLRGLNPEQAAAVTAPLGPACVLAGAGSGKTRVITHRIAWLIEQGIAPGAILAVTFTNKAAREMRERVRALTGRFEVRLATFHSFCAAFLRLEFPALGRSGNFTIYDEDDAQALLKRVLEVERIDPETHKPRQLLDRFARWKAARLSPDEVRTELADTWESHIGRAFAAYERARVEANACGFDDLMFDTVRLLEADGDVAARWQRDIQFLLVDEFQDTNPIQYELVRHLSAGHRRVCVTGDQDQAIYGWRGADPGNFDRFLEDHPDATLVRLERNYRSSGNILRAASAVIACNRQRIPKRLWTEAKDGEPVRVVGFEDDLTEARMIAETIHAMHSAQGIPYQDIAVFFRTNALSVSLERMFLQERVPYRVLGGLEFFGRTEVKDLLAYLRLLSNPNDTVSFARIANVPARGIGKKTLEDLFTLARAHALPIGHLLKDQSLTAGLSARAAKAVIGLAEVLIDLDQRPKTRVRPLLEAIVERTGYGAYWKEKASKGGSVDPYQNIGQLINVARDFDDQSETEGLDAFLAQMALLTDLDHGRETDDRVALMTLHTSKGLEFPYVFLVGAEEGLLPHIMAMNEGDNGLEEERRLFHVGVTRAMRELVITHSQMRMRFGRPQLAAPSRFLIELGRDGVQHFEPERKAARPRFEEIEPEQEDHPLATARSGAPVWHPDYGSGQIHSFQGRGRGLDRKALVRFEDGSERILVLRHSRLEPMEAFD